MVRLLVLPSGNGGISEPQFSKAHLAGGGKLGRTRSGPLSVDTTADVKQLKKLGMFNLGEERQGPRRPLFQRLRTGSWRWVAWLWVALEWGLPGDRILPKSQFSFICQLYLSDDPTDGALGCSQAVGSSPPLRDGQRGRAEQAAEVWAAQRGGAGSLGFQREERGGFLGALRS